MRVIIQVLTSLAHGARVVSTWALAIEGWKKVSVIQDACAEFQAAVQAESVANPKAPVQPKKAHMVSTVARMREYSGGALADALANIHEHGFDLGCFVTRKASADLKGAEVDSSQYKVWEARGDTVVLQDQHELLCVLSADELLSCFDLVSTQTVEVVHPQWPVNYLAHTSYLAHMVKLRIMSALYTASTADYASFDRVTVMEKPRRAVRSKGEAARGALVLVPNSMKVLTKLTSDPVVEGEVRVVHPITGDFACLSGLRFVLFSAFHEGVALCCVGSAGHSGRTLGQHVVEPSQSERRWCVGGTTGALAPGLGHFDICGGHSDFKGQASRASTAHTEGFGRWLCRCIFGGV